MARIDIKSGGTILNDGILQLENGVAMDTTLRNVADQNNTTSPLKLSTTAVQVVSPLRITTDDPSDMYLDCEDGATNNRFNITRNTASQQVNLNFASNPGGSTTIVGAIRTYVDGVNLSEVMSFREDGNIGIGTPSPTAKLNIVDNVGGTGNALLISHPSAPATLSYNPNASALTLSGGYSYLAINTFGGGSNALTLGSGGSQGYLDLKENGTTYVSLSGTSTGNAGYSYFLSQLGVGTATTLGAKMNIKGSGSTSATTSLLVQNSAGSNAFQVTDDRAVSMIGATTLKISSPSGGTLPVVFSTIGATGGFRSGYDFKSGYNGLEGNTALRIVSTTTTTNFVGIGNLADGDISGGTAKLQIDNTISGGRNAAIKLRVNFADITNQYNGIQFDTIETGNGGAFCGSQRNTAATGYGADLVVLTTAESPANTYTETARFIGRYNSFYVGTNKTLAVSSAKMQVESTTQGFLPPRMTNAQRAAITTPAVGLMVYCTDAVEGIYVYKSTGWTFVA